MTCRETLRMIDKLEQQGWTVVLGRSGHYRAKSPSGEPAFFAATPSDIRSIKNTISFLRKMGAKL